MFSSSDGGVRVRYSITGYIKVLMKTVKYVYITVIKCLVTPNRYLSYSSKDLPALKPLSMSKVSVNVSNIYACK